MKRLLAWCLALLPFLANAAFIDERLKKDDRVCGRYEIYHINGILTQPEGAAANLNGLRAAYGNGHDGHLIFYRTAYNQTRDWDNDLLDSYKQVISSYPGTTMEEYMRAIVLGLSSNILTANIVSKLSSKWAALFHIGDPTPYQDADLNALMAVIWPQPGARAILVPHSQGNLYANLVYDKLLASGKTVAKSIAIVGIATPSNTIRPGSGRYITSKNDKVINAVRALFPNTKAGTITIPVMGNDLLGHNLLGIYLTDPHSKQTIVNQMDLALDDLKTTQPHFNAQLQGRANYFYCGPHAWPTFEPPPYSCLEMINGIKTYITTNYIRYQAVGVDTWLYNIGGSPALAPGYAKAYVTGCYPKYIADRKAQILAGVPADPYSSLAKEIPGCGKGFPHGEPYGLSAAAWAMYSGDNAPSVTPAFQANPSSYHDTYMSNMTPTCRR